MTRAVTATTICHCVRLREEHFTLFCLLHFVNVNCIHWCIIRYSTYTYICVILFFVMVNITSNWTGAGNLGRICIHPMCMMNCCLYNVLKKYICTITVKKLRKLTIPYITICQNPIDCFKQLIDWLQLSVQNQTLKSEIWKKWRTSNLIGPCFLCASRSSIRYRPAGSNGTTKLLALNLSWVQDIVPINGQANAKV